jgi:uncharacterized protein (DUF952 family)
LSSLIYILCTPDAYANAQASGFYRADSLDTEGFIHASPANQLTRVANKHYVSHPELLILGIDPDKVTPDVRWEKIANGDHYPHIYGELNLDAIVATEPVSRMPDGNYEIYVTE